MFTANEPGKRGNTGIKRLALIGSRLLLLTIVVVFSLAIPVGAEPETVLTGCLNTRSGELHNVALGLKPFLPCSPMETQVTWSSGVPGVESRLAALEERVEEMESAQAPLDLTVNCPQESVMDALAQAGDRPARVIITIVGVCTEQVFIDRDNIILAGASLGDGLQAPSPDSSPLVLHGNRIALQQLTLTGGRHGILATDGANFSARDLRISGADTGIFVSQNAGGVLESSLVENNRTGIFAESGGALSIYGTTIEENSAYGVHSSFNAYVFLFDGTIIRSCGYGVTATQGGSIEIGQTTIDDNDFAVFAYAGGFITVKHSLIQNNIKAVGVHGGGTILLENGAVVANNQGHGVAGRAGGTIVLSGATIENNGSDGVSLGAGTAADISNGTIVRDNIGHGIALGANSSATFFDDTAQVTGNTGTAVMCGTVGQLDDVALIVGEPGIISGNGLDEIACPRGFP